MYDPKLARFLQADSFIQDPTNSQSLNRYSYVWNNPLNATDPSGYIVFGLIAAAAVAAQAVEGAYAIMALFAFAGFVDTQIAGGSFKDSLLAGISAAAFASLGAQLGGFTGFGDAVGDVMAMGVLGGVTTVLQGGKFGHGFRSGGLSRLTGGIAGKVSQKLNFGSLGQSVARMVAAGTTSELTGGKFANGAASAAFSSMAENFGETLLHREGEAGPRTAEERQAGTIYITGHRVGEIGPIHLAVEYTEGGDAQVISAGPVDGLLASDLNRPTDVPAVNVTIGEVRPPAGISARAYFGSLQQADLRYCDCLDYDLFPEVMDSYNSNSYVHGLIRATGGAASVDFGRYIGGPTPVPAEYFGAP